MVNSTESVCYYAILGLEPDCSMEDIRKAYKDLALKYHPDKYKDTLGISRAEANDKFLMIQDANENLVDPVKRAMFDSYREKYVVTMEKFNPDLASLDGIKFKGYSDSDRDFYNVYSDVFTKIYTTERAFQEYNNLPWNTVHKPPDMGNLETSYSEVVVFYNYWLNFSSIMDFAWEDLYDEIDLKGTVWRKKVKLWTRRNVKARKKAKKLYNIKVRELAQNAKRLDKRVIEMMAKREEEAKRKMEEEREKKKRLKMEKLERMKPESVEREKKNMDENGEYWKCLVCRKEFKSEKQCMNHEQSKKHRNMVAKLMVEVQRIQINHQDSRD